MAQRVFYASQGVSVDGTVVQGAQSVSINSNFNLQQAYQLGQVAVYNNVVTNPEVTCTINKVLDGAPTIWNLATGGGSLVENSADQVDVVVGFGEDTDLALTSTSAVTMTGMFVTSVNYTMPVDGNFTEEVGFAGFGKALSGSVTAPTTSGNTVLRRQHFLTSGGTVDLPNEVAGKNITNITISADLGRTNMFKLGQFAAFHKFVNFPLEVKCDIAVSATASDGIVVDSSAVSCTGNGSLPAEQPIIIELCDSSTGNASYTFNLGDKCRLASAAYSGGDTGGGNATITYSYVTYNTLTISG